MAQTKNKSTKMKANWNVKRFFNKNLVNKLIFDPKYLYVTCWALLISEVFLNIFIIQRVKYTEIDWIAYMQEVEGFLNGTLDYKQLKGDTGPLVYPAGFVYIYSLFYYLTEYGRNIRLAQYIFLSLYILQLYLTFRIYKVTCKIPPYALVLSTLTSYRIHSIFVLRLFNDPIAVVLFYISLNCFLSNRWLVGSIFYSSAVSVKMNILLYAPCLLLSYLINLGLKKTIINLFVCGAIQIILGLPFLYGNAFSYIKGSFDLGRVFEHKWTVNYRFLNRAAFENRSFHLFLLGLHLVLLGIFYRPIKKFLSSYAKLNMVTQEIATQVKNEKKNEKLTKKERTFLDSFEKQLKAGNKQYKEERDEKEKLVDSFGKVAQLLVLPFFVTNLIGVACARSLHYQFYSWYFHSLLYLVHCTGYRKPVIFLLLGMMEFCWNTYPSTEISSVVLHFCHIVLLYGVYRTMSQ